MTLLNDHIGIVTGAASGIGFAISKKFLHAGAKLILNDLHSNRLCKARDKLIDSGINEDCFDTSPGDISEEEDVKNLFATCHKSFGPCSLLVNNAGIIQEKAFTEISVEDWDKMINVHLRGCFLGCREALSSMKKKGQGIIINIASQLGQIGGYELGHYCAAKAGIIGLTKSLAREYGSTGIRINAIAPGPINTEMVSKLSVAWKKKKASELPLGRFGEPEDIANTALFLASEGSKIYLGQTLGPNSGDVML